MICLLFVFSGCGEKQQQVEAAATPHSEWILPEVENTSGKVQIQTVSAAVATPYNSYVITSIEGETIVLDPTVMPSKEVVDLNPAAIVSTHGHDDHVDATYFRSYDCEKAIAKEIQLNTRDFKIKTVKASHKGDEIDLVNLNVITIVEVDGLKIAHLGDLGQDHFNEEQLEALKDVDIAFMQVENQFSDMTLENKKGLQLIDAIKPPVVIITHHTEDALAVLEEAYGEVIQPENLMTIDRQDIDAIKASGQTKIYRIRNQHKYSD